MYKNNYEVNVLVNGKPVREYYQNGKFFIEARKHTEYTIKLKNHSHKKIMAVVSVDGIEVLKGGAAIEAQSGYIVNPYSATEIKGYRINNDKVAAFKFDDGKGSYATVVENDFDEKKIKKNGPSKNNGIIGVRIWEEKEPKFIEEWDNTHKQTFNKKNNYRAPFNAAGGFITGNFNLNYNIGYSGCALAPRHLSFDGGSRMYGSLCDFSVNNIDYTSCNASVGQGEYVMKSEIIASYSPKFELGTSWGKQVEDQVIKVDFLKANTFIDLELYYLTREELIKLGIDLDNHKKIFISGYPKAFGPKEEYCKQPKNWRSV